MGDIKIYDKVKWHYPEGKNCPDLDTALTHFKAIIEWLNENNLLSNEGKELYELGVDSDFSITSTMLTEKGKVILDKNYSELLKKYTYSTELTNKFINDTLMP